MNVNAWFGAKFNWSSPGHTPLLRVSASAVYRAYLNGEFVGHGPARGPHGFYRIDEWQLPAATSPRPHELVIEVAGYAANSFAYLDQASFLQAEIVWNGAILAATGDERSGFEGHIMTDRIQKVQRYSFQRPFSEAYRLTPSTRRRSLEGPDRGAVKLSVQRTVRENPWLAQRLPHRVPYPRFDIRPVMRDVSQGRLEPGQKVEKVFKDRSLTGIGETLMGYPEDQLEVLPSIELQKVTTVPKWQMNTPRDPAKPIMLDADAYRLVDFGTNLTGFIGCEIKCDWPTTLYLTFDEILSDGDVNQNRLACVNIIQLDLEPGIYPFESFEPYTLRYLKFMVLGKVGVEISGVHLRELTAPDVWEASFSCSDPRLNRLFDAGRETYRQNAVDIFMDCPSRERAGWLCDSFFTARVAMDLSGHTKIEKNFYENFLLAKHFHKIPDGMLPMCYPSDHYDGVFIPNWAMWFVIELEEYLARSGDHAMVSALKPKVLQLIKFLDEYKNEDGLLEKLPSWVFVEWSAANDFVQDVNYPSNALYAAVLDAAGRLYGMKELQGRAAAMRETIRSQSFDGRFFVDNAVRRDGKLEVTKNHTETCQYYLFFFNVATPESHPELWKILIERFGPKRFVKGLFPDVPPSNSFIGNMLRMEILSRAGRSQQILDESIDYLLYMADRTGTLWENVKPEASCNHGFASHIVHTLYRDILGVGKIDTFNDARVVLKFAPVKLDWCEGRIPTPDGFVSVRWERKGDTLTYRVDTPAGYKAEASAAESLKLQRLP